jgi:hypothetical protein
MADEWAATADDEVRKMMNYYYLKAALYEYAFWDYAYYGSEKSYDYTDVDSLETILQVKY